LIKSIHLLINLKSYFDLSKTQVFDLPQIFVPPVKLETGGRSFALTDW